MDQVQQYQEFQNSIHMKDILFVFDRKLDRYHNDLHNHAKFAVGIVEASLMEPIIEQTHHEDEIFHLYCPRCSTIVMCFMGQVGALHIHD